MAAGTGEWEIVEFNQIPTAAGVVEIRSGGGAELAVDGVSAGKGAAEVSFIPARENVTPEIQPGPVPNSRMIGYEACKQVYGVWWSFDSDFVGPLTARSGERPVALTTIAFTSRSSAAAVSETAGGRTGWIW